MSEWFEAHAPPSHASFHPRSAAHIIDGGPDPYCKGEPSKHTHHLFLILCYVVK